MSNYTYINASTVAEDPHAEDDFVRAIQRVTATLYETFPIVFLIFGTLGNTLSFAVLTRKTMRKNSTTLYLAVLAVTDLAVLWLGLTRHAAIAFQNKDVRLLHSSLCKLQRFFLYFSLDYSAWILVAVTAERCFSVYFPLKSLTTCTRKRAAIALACIATAMALKNAHVFLSRGLQFATDGDGKTILVSVCGYPSPGYKFFWSYVLPWIVFLVYALGPFLVILVHNLLIIRKVIQLRKKRETMIANSGSVNSDPTPAAVIATSSRDDGPNSQETAGTAGTSNNIAAPSNEGSSYQKRVTQMTVMLVTVSITFLVLATPSFLHGIVSPHWYRAIETDYDKAVFGLIRIIVLMLNYLNHSVNFILYCISGKQFRLNFLKLVCRKNKVGPLAQ